MTETIVFEKPSEKLLEFARTLRKEKEKKLEELGKKKDIYFPKRS